MASHPPDTAAADAASTDVERRGSGDIERRGSGRARRGEPPGMGLLKGLGVTIKHLFRRASTQQYPHEQPDLAPRTRGVIGLMDENCTVCMLCARECPDWCIYIDSHKETVPPAREGGRERTRNVLDRFAIDFALCMYCGICIEVCPFDALFWSPRFDYSTYEIDGLLHEKERLREWMDTVPPPPPLERGAEPAPEVASALETAQRELEQAREQRRRELEQARSGRAPAEADRPEAGADTAAPAEPEVEIEAGKIDQETYDRLVEEGASERVARAKAKAAYVRKAKKRAREQQAREQEAREQAPDQQTRAEPEVEIEAGRIDQETYDRLVEEGKSERIARAKAKAAYVRKARQAARREQAQPATTTDGDGARPEARERTAPAAAPDEAEEAAPDELDQDTYDRLVAHGVSERVARARARAAWVVQQRQAELRDGAPGSNGG